MKKLRTLISFQTHKTFVQVYIKTSYNQNLMIQKVHKAAAKLIHMNQTV